MTIKFDVRINRKGENPVASIDMSNKNGVHVVFRDNLHVTDKYMIDQMQIIGNQYEKDIVSNRLSS